MFGLANCDKETTEPDPPAPAPEKTLVGEEFAIGSGLKIQYHATEDPFVGYNKIYLTVKDSVTGNVVSGDLNIMIMPMMDMGMMMHSCPTEAVEYNSDTKEFIGAITYVMPSTAGTWTITTTVTDNGTGLTGVAVFDFEVVEPEEVQLTSFISDLDPTAKFFISLITPKDPQVGENDFEIIINRKASMMDWPYEPYLTVEIDPQMPSMNHGSPNNVNPTHIGDGHYKGVTNFTMTGWWRVNMVIKDGEGNIIKDDVYLDITF